MRILVVDDEPQLVRALRITMRARGYQIDTATTGAQALDRAAHTPPDLVLLDLGLPDMDGREVIEGLRGWTQAPIIVLSGRSDSRVKVDALDAGANDYVTKPFDMSELLARIRAAARTHDGASVARPVRAFGPDVTVDLAARTVESRRGADTESVRLTPTEWRLLELFLRNPGRLVTHETILTEVWGPGYPGGTGNVRLYVNQLRHKLEEEPSHPRHLLTEPGMGYRFQP